MISRALSSLRSSRTSVTPASPLPMIRVRLLMGRLSTEASRSASGAFELVVGADGFGGIHQARATAHVNADGQRFHELFAGHAELDQGLDVKADAGIAARGDADSQRR